MDLKRYGYYDYDGLGPSFMDESEVGGWVRYEDAKTEIERLTKELGEATGALETADKEIERLTKELALRRKSGSASDRLHNICEGLREDADSSPFSREEWDRLDTENVALRKERDALRLDAERMDWLERQHVEVRYPLRYGSRKGFHTCPDINDGKQEPSDLRAAIAVAMTEKP